MDFFASAAESVRLAKEQAQQAAEAFTKDNDPGPAAQDKATLSDKSPEELKVYINKLVKLSRGEKSTFA